MEEEKIDVALKTAKAEGIRNIVALRGGKKSHVGAHPVSSLECCSLARCYLG